MASGSDHTIREAVLPLLSDRAMDLEDLVVKASGQHRSIRVVVDRDGGVDLDSAAEASRAVAEALDALGDAVLGGAAYTLEVTSRGVGSPLTLPRHWKRAHGRLVALTMADGSRRTVRACAVCGDDIIVFDGKDGTVERTIALADIARAAVEVEFAAPSPAVVEALVRGAGSRREGGQGQSAGVTASAAGSADQSAVAGEKGESAP